MASYFDEHDCQPTPDSGPELNTLLHWARLLLNDVRLFASRYEGFDLPEELKKAPPASKKFVKELPEEEVSPGSSKQGLKCPICLQKYSTGSIVKTLPCKHNFHSQCILPWLEQTNSCPLCRHELPTDDPGYEEYRKDKARAKQREFETESLHNSMYT